MNFKIALLLAFLIICVPLGANSQENQSAIDSCLHAAEVFESQADFYNEALSYSDAIKYAREAKSDQLPEILLMYAQHLSYLGDYSAAIASLEEAEKLMSDEDKLNRARIMSTYGAYYFFMHDFDEALKYYKNSLDLAVEIDSKIGIAISQSNIGGTYEELKRYDEAIDMFNRSLEIQNELHDSSTICNTYHNMATCYEAMQNYDKSKQYFLLSYDVACAINDLEITSLCLEGLGRISAVDEKYTEAEEYFDKSEKIAFDNGLRQVLQRVYGTKRDFYEKRDMYKEAYHYQKLYQEISDSLFSENMTNSLNAQRVKYDLRDKEQQIEAQNETINHQKSIRNSFIIVICLLLVVIVLVIRTWKVQRKRNKELEMINSTKDKFISIISHDLKNPAIAHKNALQAVCDNFDDLDWESIRHCCNELLRSSDALVKLLFDLLNWSQMELGRMPFNPAAYNLNDLVQKVVNLGRLTADSKNIKIVTDIPPSTMIFVDKNFFETIMRNLLSNAFKFSKPSSEVKVFAKCDSKQCVVSVLDNGVGIPAEKIKGIFDVGVKKSTLGTRGEAGNGLGLAVCDQMVRKNGGTINVESEYGKYTQFNFTVKIADD